MMDWAGMHELFSCTSQEIEYNLLQQDQTLNRRQSISQILFFSLVERTSQLIGSLLFLMYNWQMLTSRGYSHVTYRAQTGRNPKTHTREKQRETPSQSGPVTPSRRKLPRQPHVPRPSTTASPNQSRYVPLSLSFEVFRSLSWLARERQSSS